MLLERWRGGVRGARYGIGFAGLDASFGGGHGGSESLFGRCGGENWGNKWVEKFSLSVSPEINSFRLLTF
jgi:hypothetical protein